METEAIEGGPTPPVGSGLDLSVVIACLDEERVLERNVARMIEVLDATPWRYEILFVDDGSRDRTWESIERLCERDPTRRLRAVRHAATLGRGRAVADGFRLARGRVAGYIDVDLEVDAGYIPVLVREVLAGADVATARRVYELEPRALGRWLVSLTYAHLVRLLLAVPLRDTETGCKFFDRRILDPLLDDVRHDGWFWDTEIMVRSYLAGLRIVEIPCSFVRKYDQPSSVRLVPDTVDYLRSLWRFRSVVKGREAHAATRRRIDRSIESDRRRRRGAMSGTR